MLLSGRKLIWLKQSFALFLQDRGVLRPDDSRMESKVSGFTNSSQGTKELEVLKKFWLFRHTMCCKAESSSIQLLIIATFAVAFFLPYSSSAQMQSQLKTRQQQIEGVGEAFEAMYLQRLLQQMRSSNDIIGDSKENPFRKSNAEKIFQSMLDQDLVKNMASQNPIGIKDLVVRQLTGKSGVRSRTLVE